MKTKTKTRVLSWIVSICLIAAIIPAIPAEYASAATGATYVYDFTGLTSEVIDLVTDVAASSATVTDDIKSPYDTYDEITALNSNTAEWYLSTAKIAGSKTNQSQYVRLGDTAIYTSMRYSTTATVDVMINVANSGWYDLKTKISYTLKGNNTGYATVEFVNDGVSATSSVNLTGDLSLGRAYLTAGDHLVRYTLKSQTGSTSKDNLTNLYMYSLTLTEVVPEIVMDNYATAVEIGDTLKVSGVKVGETTFEADNVEVAVTSEFDGGKGAISVGEDGTLTAVKAGSSEITVTATYDTDKTASSKYYITVRPETVDNEYVYYMTGQSADNTMLLGNAVNKTYSTLSQEWTLDSFAHSSSGVRDRSQLQNWRGVNITVNGSNENGSADIILQAPESGWYKLSAEIAEGTDVKASFQFKNGNSVLTGCSDAASGTNENVADNVVYLEKGVDYTFTFASTTIGVSVTRSRSYLFSIKLTAIPASEIFGDTYAYVKDGTVYFIGGLNTIEGYSEVGFEVTVDGVEAGDIKTSEVYKSFTVTTSEGAKEKTASDFGADCEYIFITEKTGLAAGNVVIVKPYIKDAAGTKHYHDEDFNLKLTI